MIKKTTNKTTKNVASTSSWAESTSKSAAKPNPPLPREHDEDEEEMNVVSVFTTSSATPKSTSSSTPVPKSKPAPPTTSAVSKQQSSPQQLSPEIKAQLNLRLAEINGYIKHFRNLGYYTRADGTLAEPEQLVVEQTNVPAKIITEGNRFYLDVGSNRKHNELIKKLGGHWASYKSAWKFDSLALLQNVRDSFDITEEIQGTYSSSNQRPQIVKRDGKIVLEELGMYIIIRGDTKPIKDDLKAVVQNLRWDAEEGHWVANKQFKVQIEEKLTELQDEGRVTNWEYQEAE